MTSPADDYRHAEYDEKHFAPQYQTQNQHPQGGSSDENTVIGENSADASHAFPSFDNDDTATIEQTQTYGESQHERNQDPRRLRVQTSRLTGFEPSIRSIKSPSQTREEASRLDDDLRMLQVEQQISAIAEEEEETKARTSNLDRTTTHHSVKRERSHRSDGIDEFDIATNPLHETTKLYKPPTHPTTALAKFFKMIHQRSFLVRWFTYIVPVVIILLIPLLVGALVPQAQGSSVGGVSLLWFSVWLEIVWLTLWAGRLLAKFLPWPIGLISSLFTDNSKKWRDMVKQLEVSATLFFWWLGVEISFLPTMKNHHVNGDKTTKSWENILNKIIVAIFVCAVLNFAEKIIIQLIAISFHQRTYADRIELNKFQIGSLTKLYTYSKDKLRVADSDFEAQEPASGARTPGQYLTQAQRGTVQAFNKFGDVAGKVAGDFTGRTIKQSSHPSMVILALLNSTSGSQVLARRLYRTFAREDTQTVLQEDLRYAYENDEECEAAFSMFDKDMNGDISMEELEAVCVEIGRERKAITASLKDLDSVVGKLDNCLLFAVVVISVLVFISLISTSAAGVLTSAGSTVLALSWLLQATAQEFLQSLVFVFIKHPFDVGDRITVYGNTGSTLKGDDYFVKEISLLYTEFKKMEGHVVQAPNSYLNTLFILNQRRSGGLAEAVPIIWKFGTTLEQIDGVRQKLLDFVKAEKREYQPNILTELRDVTEAHSISLNIVFFFKSNWQNEGLRLQRRNKFICALMIAMQEMGVEGPNMRFPGMRESFPLYMQHIPFAAEQSGRGGHPDNPGGLGKLPTYNEASEAGNHETSLRDATIPEEHEFEQMSPQDRHAPITSAFQSNQQNALDRIRSPSGATTSASVNQVPASATTMRRRGPSILDTSGRHRGESVVRRTRQESIAQISRRMDFSLGMEGHSSGNYAGDVFEDRERTRPRVPQMNVTSPSTSRARGASPSIRRPSHASDATAHTIDSAIVGARKGLNPFGPGMLTRAGTEGSRPATTHRNRFFSTRRSAEAERPGRSMTLQFGEDLRNMESGLAGIQEVPTPGMPMSERRLGYGAFASSGQIGRMDPRTGFVSPVAVRMDSEEAETSSVAPERAADGRPLFQAARLASNDFAAASASLGGTDGTTQQAQQVGILEGERIVADLQARARQRGMTNDTVGTGIDPLTTTSAASAQRRLQSVDSRVASQSRERFQAPSNTLQPTVSTLSTAETEHIITPSVEATEADVQPREEVHTGPSAETGDLAALRGRQDLRPKASAGSQNATDGA